MCKPNTLFGARMSPDQVRPRVLPMWKFVVALSIASLALPPASAVAETLRCNGYSSGEGDSKLSVLYKCGEPLLKDAFCAPLYGAQSPYPLPEPFAGAVLTCQLVEEWLYDRGPGNLMATVRFRGGQVLSIRYSRSPQ